MSANGRDRVAAMERTVRRQLKGKPIGLPAATLVEALGEHHSAPQRLAWRVLESMTWRGLLRRHEGRLALVTQRTRMGTPR